MSLAPISAISFELNRFDTQLMENPDISGVGYQQGELAGFEVREYLLDKWGRKCAYCGAIDVPFEVEHIIPKSRGGSNRISNLTLSCARCNQEKGNKTAGEYGHPEVQAHAKVPLRDAAMMNATRWAIWGKLKDIGLPVEAGTGGRTKFNRSEHGYPKAHWIDAACVGESGRQIQIAADHVPLIIAATGHGSRQMCATDAYGFPRQHKKRQKRHHGFVTGDIVRADKPKGKNAGIHIGRVVVRASGSFDLVKRGREPGRISVNAKYCEPVHRADGYSYGHGPTPRELGEVGPV